MSSFPHALYVATNGVWPDLKACLQRLAAWPAEHHHCSLSPEETHPGKPWSHLPTLWMWNAGKQWNQLHVTARTRSATDPVVFLWLRHGATPSAVEDLMRRAQVDASALCLIEHPVGLLVSGTPATFAKLPSPQMGTGWFDDHVGNSRLCDDLQDRAATVGIPVQRQDLRQTQLSPFGQHGSPFISVCMIVKNGAAFLAQCLESLADAADKVIIVLDAATTDDTATIAHAYGAQVIERPWDDHFANARNAGLDRARGQWILFLDADEVLEPGAGPRLRKAAAKMAKSYVFIPVFSYTAEGEASGSQASLNRLAPNLPHVRFVGAIHEEFGGPPLPRIAIEDVKLYHYGYIGELGRQKLARNERYVLESWRQNPGDARLSWFLGASYIGRNDFKQALPVLEGVKRGHSNWHLLVQHMHAEILFQLDRPTEALALLDDLLRKGNGYPPAHLLRGNIWLKQKNLALARAEFEKALTATWDADVWRHQVVEKEDHEAASLTGLGLVALQEGNLAEAERLTNDALRKTPSSTIAHLAMADILVAQGRLSTALDHLAKARARASEGGLTGIQLDSARVYIAMAQPEKAKVLLDGAEPSERVFVLRGRIAELTGEWEVALACWQQALQTQSNPLYLAHRAACRIQLKDLPAAMADLEQIMPNGELTTPYGYVPMAMLAELTGNYGEAYQYLLEAYKAGIAEVDVLLFLSQMALAGGAPADAHNAAAAVLAVNPELAEARRIYDLTR